MNKFCLSFIPAIGVNLTEFDVGSMQQTETSSSSHHNHTATKQQHEIIPSDVDSNEADQLVKPSKIHVQPLHADDLLYESMKFEPGAGQTCSHTVFFCARQCAKTEEFFYYYGSSER